MSDDVFADYDTVRTRYVDDELEGCTVEHPHYGRGTVRETTDDRMAFIDYEERHDPVQSGLRNLTLVTED